MLIIIGGPDRVGKSTLASELSRISGLPVKHHREPDLNSKSIFEVYRDNLRSGESQIWDRSYLCAFVYERFRKRTHDHLVEVMDLEFEISKTHQVVHVGVTRPWYWAAPLHYEELLSNHPLESPWALRDRFMSRQSEHHFYIEEMVNFYQYVTMFPSFMVEPAWTPNDVWLNIQAILDSDRPKFTTG